MDKKETFVGGRTDETGLDKIIHKNPSESADRRGAIAALTRQIQRKEITDQEYNERLVMIQGDVTAAHPNQNVAQQGVSKITYAEPEFVEQANLEAIDGQIADVQAGIQNMADSMDSGRTVNKHAIERLGKILQDAKIRAEGAGANVDNQAFIDLTAKVREMQALAYEYRRARR